MSDPKNYSGVTFPESFLSRHATHDEFDSPNTARYFEAWLENLRPSPSNEQSVLPPVAPARNDHNGFTFEGTLQIDCCVSAMISSERGTLIVGETGEVDADVYVANSLIDGIVRGDIHATDLVELGSNARVTGNITAPSISIREGAVFEGLCQFAQAVSSDTQALSDNGRDSATSVGLTSEAFKSVAAR